METKSVKATAEYFNICTKSISLRLKNNNINVDPGGDIYNTNRAWQTKKIAQFDSNNIKLNEFASASQAANYLIDQGITSAKAKSVSCNIGRCCKNERHMAYGYIWQYVE